MPLEWKAPLDTFADPQDVRSVFETIYANNIWGGGSGYGSHPDMAGPYVSFLTAFIKNNRVRSIVDIGCGDWQFSRHIDWSDRTYLGIDVVKPVIEENIQRFAKPNVTFMHANPIEEDLDLSGDLLILKDVLQHLSNANVQRLLRLVSRFRFSLITNAWATRNDDCENGDTRPLDIRAEPFNLTDAVLVCAYHDKGVFLVMNRPAAG